jgi:hypothetical protein
MPATDARMLAALLVQDPTQGAIWQMRGAEPWPSSRDFAANRSFETGQPVRTAGVLDLN